MHALQMRSNNETRKHARCGAHMSECRINAAQATKSTNVSPSKPTKISRAHETAKLGRANIHTGQSIIQLFTKSLQTTTPYIPPHAAEPHVLYLSIVALAG